MKQKILLTGILVVLLSFSFFGEKVFNAGAGWDGDLFYREMAKSFSETVFNESYSAKYIQRSLPWAFMNVILDISKIDKSDMNIMYFSLLLNFGFIVFGVIGYFKVANELKLSNKISVIGFSLFFFNFIILKMSGYYPILNDVFAYSLSFWIILFFLRNQRLKLSITGLFTAFIWAHSWVISLVLLGLPRNAINLNEEFASHTSTLGHKITDLIKYFIVLLILIVSAGITYYFFVVKSMNYLPIALNLEEYNKGNSLILITISALAFASLVFIALKPIRFNLFLLVKNTIKSITIKNLLFVIIAYFAVNQVVMLLANNNFVAESVSHSFIDFPFKHTIVRLFGEPLILPLQFLPNHLIYYGLFIVLLILFWKELIRTIGNIGFSYSLIFFYSMVMITQPESRFFVHLLPFVTFPLLIILNEKFEFKHWVPYFFIFTQLLISKFWYKINLPGIEESFLTVEGYMNFPAQNFFMNLGPWQSTQSYLIFMGVFLFLLFVFFYLFKTKKGLSLICNKACDHEPTS